MQIGKEVFEGRSFELLQHRPTSSISPCWARAMINWWRVGKDTGSITVDVGF